MSASHRSLKRLPNSIFIDLTSNHDTLCDSLTTASSPKNLSPLELQSEICKKLKELGSSSNNISSNDNGVGVHNVSHNMNATSSRKQEARGGIGSITTVGQIMRLTPPALLRALDPLLTNEECQELIRRISDYCAPIPKTAKELLYEFQHEKDKEEDCHPEKYHHNEIYLPTDVPQLDTILRGGIRLKTITEIVGRAGVGKTQLVMQLATVAAAYDMGSIYIDTERKLSLARLNEIATERYEYNQNSSYSNINDNNDSNGGKENKENNEKVVKYKAPIDVLNNISVHTPDSTSDLLSVISGLQEEIVLRCNSDSSNSTQIDEECVTSRDEMKENSTSYPVKLIILDSIAAPARRDFGGEDARDRVTAIFQIAQMLKQIADEMSVAVVVINQIEKVLNKQDPKNYSNNIERDNLPSNIKVSLGTSWHHCVSTRILLDHNVDPHRDDSYALHYLDNNTGRKATVVKSNIVGSASMSFEVTSMGICQL